MDKGSGAATEYEFSQDVADYIMDKIQGVEGISEPDPSWMGIKIGHIHSHHSMNVFFSGTDMSELVINCSNHNFYLSLIVNNFMEMTAKLVYKVFPCAYLSRDENGEEYEMGALGNEVPLMFIHDCTIERPAQEELVNEAFSKRVKEIMEKVKVVPQVEYGNNYSYPGGVHQSWDNKEKDNPQQKAFDKLIGQGDNSSKKEEKQVISNEKPNEKEEDLITFPGVSSLDEELACYLIRLGEVFPDDDLEQALAVIKDEGVDGAKLISAIMPKIGDMYAKFMILAKEIENIDEIEMDDFLLSLETVNDLLSDYEGKYPFVIPLMKEISEFVVLTEHAWREYAFGHSITLPTN